MKLKYNKIFLKNSGVLLQINLFEDRPQGPNPISQPLIRDNVTTNVLNAKKLSDKLVF